MWRSLALLLLATRFASADDFRLDFVRQSLTGTHIHYQQYLDGIRVIGGVRIESIGIDGRREVVERLAAQAGSLRTRRLGAGVTFGELVYLNIDGDARAVSRVVVEEMPFRRYANYYDAVSGALIRSDPLFWTANGRVFDPNPVAKLNAPNLQDQNDAVSAVSEAAYSSVDLPDLPPSGPLAGPNVQIVDTDAPHPARADASQSLRFDRQQTQFEEVNAYYHIDRSQRYLQSLGYTGPRRLVAYSIPVDAHAASGTDNSFFVSGATTGLGALFFGDGGTDDAEDSDIMLHEFGHAIQEWIVPGVFGGPASGQARALGEGFGDYWAFSSSYAQAVVSGRDPFCIGDWDARCWNDDSSQLCGYPAGSDCLRRVDGSKTMSDYIASDASGTEHKNGEIWSSALREIFLDLTSRYGTDRGKRMADTLVLESNFGVPAAPTFALMARKLLDADRAINNGAHVPLVCAAMTARGILAPVDCTPPPRGEVTWFQSVDHGVSGNAITSTLTINDPRPVDRLTVNVAIEGAAQITLIAPDGMRAQLSGGQALDVFRGRSAAGTWTLTVSGNQPVTLRSWSLAIQFAGDQPAVTRPVIAGRQKHIAAVAHTPGANGTLFITDVRILNRGRSSVEIMAIFTPSGSDGRTNFAAVKMVIAAGQLMALDDVVQTTMQTAGIGQLALAGLTEQLIVNSRTYTRGARGTFGQFVPSGDPQEAVGSGDPPLSIPQLQNTAEFRSNIGFAEVAGAAAEVHVRLYNAGGVAVSDEIYGLAPFGHIQSRVGATGEALRAEVSVVGAGRVLAYGSTIDNRSGDAMFIPAARFRKGFLPAIHSPGVFGTTWRTDVWLSNTGPADERIDLPTRSVHVLARGAVVVRDVLGAEGRKVVLVLPATAVLVTSRTYTTGSEGTFGQFVPPTLEALHRSDPPATMVGIENSAAFRTNIGLMNTSETPATVRLIFYDGAGREVARSEVAVSGLVQVPVTVPLVAGGVTAELIDGAGAVIPYASVIDNVSGDPIYINAQY
jgi:hypothetical protein